MAAAATSSRSARTSGPASAWCAAAPAPRWSAIPQTVAARIREYQDVGIDTFIMSGYPHLEEAYRFAELVFPLLSLAAAEQRDADPRQHRAVRRDHRQRTPAASQGIAIMSLIDSLPRVRALRLPRADGLIPWIVPLAIIADLAGRLRHRLRVRRACCRRRAMSRWRAGSCCCRANWCATSGSASGAPASALLIGGGIGFALRPRQRPVAALRAS